MNTPVRFNSLTTLRNFLYVIGDSTPNGLFIIANEYRIITKPQIVTFELSYNLIINDITHLSLMYLHRTLIIVSGLQVG